MQRKQREKNLKKKYIKIFFFLKYIFTYYIIFSHFFFVLLAYYIYTITNK